MVRALITGASRGIGRATSERLARDGFDVVLHYNTHRGEAEEVARRIRALGRSVEVIGGDLATVQGVERIAGQVLEDPRGLDVLVNNAGSYPRRTFAEIDSLEFARCFQANVFGPAELTRRLVPKLRNSVRARVIFISSVLAFDGSRHGAHYAASKAAVLGLARSLARELAPSITVNVVAPGSIDTAILADDTPEVRAERVTRIPLRRIGTSEDIAGAVAFLASPDSSYMTGATLHVNGGTRME
jgi:3-oxoacyl-[acyl-carrier protein] reductase